MNGNLFSIPSRPHSNIRIRLTLPEYHTGVILKIHESVSEINMKPRQSERNNRKLKKTASRVFYRIRELYSNTNFGIVTPPSGDTPSVLSKESLRGRYRTYSSMLPKKWSWGETLRVPLQFFRFIIIFSFRKHILQDIKLKKKTIRSIRSSDINMSELFQLAF